MKKIINIDGVDVAFRASAATTFKYRQKFGRDMMKDMARISELSEEKGKSAMEYSGEALDTFFHLAYIMAAQANPSIPDNPDDWLDSFDVFPIDVVFPAIADLWRTTMQTVDQPKKA